MRVLLKVDLSVETFFHRLAEEVDRISLPKNKYGIRGDVAGDADGALIPRGRLNAKFFDRRHVQFRSARKDNTHADVMSQFDTVTGQF